MSTATQHRDKMDPADFTLCYIVEELASVTERLRGAATILVDCEGNGLGFKGGSLSLIALGTSAPQQPHIYLIDVITLGTSALRPIFDILASDDVRKVLFDARMDQSALFYGQGGVLMNNVVDLQLADVKSRALRGEGSDEQLSRLSPYLLRNEVRANVHLHENMHKLAGLEQAIREHKVDVGKAQLTINGSYSSHPSHVQMLIPPDSASPSRELVQPPPLSNLPGVRGECHNPDSGRVV